MEHLLKSLTAACEIPRKEDSAEPVTLSCQKVDPIVPGSECKASGLSSSVRYLPREVREWLCSQPSLEGFRLGTHISCLRLAGELLVTESTYNLVEPNEKSGNMTA